MKVFLKNIPFIVLLMSAVAWIFPILAGAQEPKNIIITDITGQKEKVESPTLEYSDNHGNRYREYFEVITPGSPRKSSWIHFSQIKTATFEQTKKEPKIAIVTESGKTLSGIFPDPDLKISGEGELGKATYALKKIKSIEFVHFAELVKDKWVSIDREAASLEWKKSRKSERFPIIMTIIDGKATIKAEGLQFRDSYDTNVRGIMRYGGRTFREGALSSTITIQRGASQVEVNLGDLEALEITGRKVDGRPEVILTRKGGNKFTVMLLMREWKNDDNTGRYGDIEPDDMLVWNSEHGFEGISLFPLRPMTLNVQK